MMKSLFLVAMMAMVFVSALANPPPPPSPLQPLNSSALGQFVCPRQSLFRTAANGRLVNYVSVRNCASRGVDVNANMFRFQINTLNQPDIRFEYFARQTDAQPGFFTDLAIGRVCEYVEHNGVPGFQQASNDTLVANSCYVLAQQQFNPISIQQTVVDSSATLYTVTAQTTDNKFRLAFEFTTATLVNATTNTTRTRYIPGTAKIDVDVMNWVYSSPSSTGLAMRSFLVGNTFGPKNNTAGAQTFFPTQPGYSFMNNGQLTNAFFSWVESAEDAAGNPLTIYTDDSIPLNQDRNLLIQQSPATSGLRTLPANMNVKSMWFSVASRATSIFWDPTMGVIDSGDALIVGQVNAAAGVKPSVFLLGSAILAAAFAFLF